MKTLITVTFATILALSTTACDSGSQGNDQETDAQAIATTDAGLGSTDADMSPKRSDAGSILDTLMSGAPTDAQPVTIDAKPVQAEGFRHPELVALFTRSLDGVYTVNSENEVMMIAGQPPYPAIWTRIAMFPLNKPCEYSGLLTIGGVYKGAKLTPINASGLPGPFPFTITRFATEADVRRLGIKARTTSPFSIDEFLDYMLSQFGSDDTIAKIAEMNNTVSPMSQLYCKEAG